MGTMLPKRVLKGKILSGHDGAETITIQNLEVIEINVNENYILVSGNIPGAKNSLVLIKTAVKNSRKKYVKTHHKNHIAFSMEISYNRCIMHHIIILCSAKTIIH